MDHMLIFGGIHEVTKELDDMIAFNLKTNTWNVLFTEYIAPKVQEVTASPTKLTRSKTISKDTPDTNAKPH